MNIQCAICQDGLEPSQDINIIPCGHVFHFSCLYQWFEKSLTCPQCRQKVRKDKMTKIYFNYANVEVIKEDSFTLQQKVDSLSFQLKLKETEANKNKQELVTLKIQNIGLRDEVKKTESQINEKISANYALKEQMAYFKDRSQQYDKLKEQNNRLCKTLETYDNIQALISASGEEVDKILGTNKDVTTLTTYVAILKRELNTNLDKRKELRGIIRNLQSEVQLLKMKRDNFTQDYIKRIEELEEELTICRSERDTLQEQISELTRRENSVTSSNEEFARESNLISENRTSRKRDIDSKENSDIISKKVKKSQEIFKLPSSPNNDDIIFVETNSKKTNDNAENSPYLPTKSNGILSLKSRALSGSRSSNWIQSMGKSTSSTKTDSSSKTKISREKDSAIAFDGFGGHSKIDAFPLPKSSLNKLKRSSSDLGKNKRMKLDNKIDGYVINLS